MGTHFPPTKFYLVRKCAREHCERVVMSSCSFHDTPPPQLSADLENKYVNEPWMDAVRVLSKEGYCKLWTCSCCSCRLIRHCQEWHVIHLSVACLVPAVDRHEKQPSISYRVALLHNQITVMYTFVLPPAKMNTYI